MIAADYLAQLAALLPPGPALPREPDGALMRLLGMPAAELARVEVRAAALLDESDPRVTSEMLVEWEAAYGLPDACVGEGQTLRQRRDALLARVAGIGGQSRSYFIATAAAMGFPVAISEPKPFRLGHSGCGAGLRDAAWAHVWIVYALGGGERSFLIGVSGIGEPLRVWGSTLLECVLGRLAPAHTKVLFAYGEAFPLATDEGELLEIDPAGLPT